MVLWTFLVFSTDLSSRWPRLRALMHLTPLVGFNTPFESLRRAARRFSRSSVLFSKPQMAKHFAQDRIDGPHFQNLEFTCKGENFGLRVKGIEPRPSYRI